MQAFLPQLKYRFKQHVQGKQFTLKYDKAEVLQKLANTGRTFVPDPSQSQDDLEEIIPDEAADEEIKLLKLLPGYIETVEQLWNDQLIEAFKSSLKLTDAESKAKTSLLIALRHPTSASLPPLTPSALWWSRLYFKDWLWVTVLEKQFFESVSKIIEITKRELPSEKDEDLLERRWYGALEKGREVLQKRVSSFCDNASDRLRDAITSSKLPSDFRLTPPEKKELFQTSLQLGLIKKLLPKRGIGSPSTGRQEALKKLIQSYVEKRPPTV